MPGRGPVVAADPSRPARGEPTSGGETASAAAAGPARLGDRPVQLPLPVLHAQDGVWPRPRLRPRAEILSFEEITRVVGAAAALGVTKVRLTGGEPLVRRDLERLVAMLAAVEGISDLALTTNGTLLAAKARALRDAGLRA